MKALYVLILLFSVVAVESRAQGYLKSEYMPSSPFGYEEGDKFGSGDLLKISGGYSLPFAVKVNERGQIRMWAASIHDIRFHHA